MSDDHVIPSSFIDKVVEKGPASRVKGNPIDGLLKSITFFPMIANGNPEYHSGPVRVRLMMTAYDALYLCCPIDNLIKAIGDEIIEKYTGKDDRNVAMELRRQLVAVVDRIDDAFMAEP